MSTPGSRLVWSPRRLDGAVLATLTPRQWLAYCRNRCARDRRLAERLGQTRRRD